MNVKVGNELVDLAQRDSELAAQDRTWYNKLSPVFPHKPPQGNYEREDIYIPATVSSAAREMVHMVLLSGMLLQ